MIKKNIDQSSGTKFFVIEPNRSITWERLLIVYGLISAVCITIAIAFAVQGLWLILPFAGLEILVLGIGFYLTFYRCSLTEVIRINDHILYIEKGRVRPELEYKFYTAWVKVKYSKNKLEHYPGRLTVSSHGNSVEVGTDLNEDDKQSLATQINRQLAALRQ